MPGVDPFMVVVLIATPIVGVAFVLVWRWQTNRWARAERQHLHHHDDYEGDGMAPDGKPKQPRVVVRDDNSGGPA
ncbi:MAG: hypothetical protein KGS45_03160 [Planctomycetes bacterium]|nr:hypothetical protein [Planctomycetota bacterium]